jgi:glycosyltransferase involved in cell wall biosynthesis
MTREPGDPFAADNQQLLGTRDLLLQEGTKGKQGVLFVMPTPRYGPTGLVASWIVLAGWVAAAEEIWGNVWIRTPEGVLSGREMASLTAGGDSPTVGRRIDHGPIRMIAATAWHDLRQLSRARRFRSAAAKGPWMGRDLAFVWQRHDVFHTAGFQVARALSKPLVLYVAAPLIWEKSRWGLRRPGWGGLVERFGERPQFGSADLLACVSEEVAEQVLKRGAREEQILVTPNGVDLDLFKPTTSSGLRDSLGLADRFVVGWAGTFRPFHAAEMALEAAMKLRDSIPELSLLLVGDGRERSRIEELAHRMRLTNVVFTGAVPYREMPRYLGAMDVVLLLDHGRGGFHYSPLKLREYMACARAIVAPRVGEIPRLVKDGREAVLVPPGDAHALAVAIERLHRDPTLRIRLGAAARQGIMTDGTWRHQVERVWAALESGPKRKTPGKSYGDRD